MRKKVKSHLRKGGGLEKVRRVLSGVVYMTKSRGSRTEPRGTAQEEICSEEKSLSHLTRK